MKRAALTMTFLTVALTAVSARAEDGLYAGAYETVTNNVVEATTQAGPVMTQDSGAIWKTGVGTWTLPIGAFDGLGNVNLVARNGSMLFDYDSTERKTVACPTDVMARKALFWFDASLADTKPELFANDKSGGDYVDMMYDARETDPANRQYPCAVAEHVFRYINDAGAKATSNNAEIIKSPELAMRDGRRAIWFGGTASGRRMALWRKGKTATQDTYDVRHAFAVHEITDGYIGVFEGNLRPTGQWSGLPATSPTANDRSLGNVLLHVDNMGSLLGVWMYVNGLRVDAFTDVPKRGFYIYEYEMTENPNAAFITGLFVNNNAGDGPAIKIADETTRATVGQLGGGGYLHEAIAFTNRLTAAERNQVYAYLSRKWNVGSAGTIDLSAAKGASVGVTTATDVTNAIPRSAQLGTFVKAGEGTLWTGRDANDVRFQVTPLRIDAGRVAQQRPMPVEAAGGRRVTSAFTPETELLSSASDAPADTFVKDGAALAYVKRIPDDVKTIEVQGGQLAFVPSNVPESDANLGEAGDDIFVTVPNASFEERKAGDEDMKTKMLTGTYCGWTYNGGRVGIYDIDKWGLDENAPSGFDGATRNQWGLTARPHDGSTAIMLRNQGMAWTTVEIPQAGLYELSYWTSTRYGDGNVGGVTDVILSNVVTHVAVRSRQVQPYRAADGFGNIRIRFNLTAAGQHRLMFVVPNNYDTSATTCVDDIQLRRCRSSEYAADPTEWKIPNGDFDGSSFHEGKLTKVFSETNNALEGWTFTQPAGYETKNLKLGVGMASAAMRRPWVNGNNTTPYYCMYLNPYHSPHLTFTTNNAAVSTTFTPPRGTWYLKADVGNNGQGNKPELTATVVIGGKESSLGVLVSKRCAMVRSRWPNTFTVDGETPVTLTLTLTKMSAINKDSDSKRGLMYLDNVALSARAVDGLVGNAVVKTWTESGWASVGGLGGQNVAGSVDYKLYPTHGTDPFGGQFGTFVRYCGIAYQDVDFPKAGLYRWSWYGHRQCNMSDDYKNPLRLWVAKGSWTNEVAYVNAGVQSNLVEYSTVFRIPEKGNYRVAYQGTYAEGGKQCDAVVDNVTIATAEAEELPQTDTFFPSNLVMNVAKGARIHLGFEGTNHIERLRLGKRSVSGFVSAKTHPDYIAGPGVLEVPNHGMYILVR